MGEAGTSGGRAGTSGEPPPARRILAIAAAITLTIAVVNALTVADDFAGVGQPLDRWEPWVWELTSAAFWIAVAVPLVRLSRRLRPPALGWPAAIAAHVLLSLPVCALHVAWLAASRAGVYAALELSYAYDWSGSHLLYEWRKDLLSVVAFALTGFILERLAAPAGALPPAPPPFRLEVRDGARTAWLAPAEIERAEAAGNYVALHTARGELLHRATLASLETGLAPHGFVRIHRSRLVRRDAVTALANAPTGDFTVTLASGAAVQGSRRFRSALG